MSFAPAAPGSRRSGRTDTGFVLGPDQGDAFHWLGSLSLTKVIGSDSGGRFDLVEGTLDVTCGDDVWHVVPGSVVFLPRGVPHGFVANGPARTLLINAVAGFGDVVVGTRTDGLELPGPDVPMPEPEQIGAVSAKYGIEPVPPPETDA